MKMKKVLAMLLAAVMAASMAACTGTAPAATEAPAATAAATEAVTEAPAADTEAAKTYTVGICQLVQHPALDAATEGFKAALTEALGDAVTFNEQNASGESTNCATIINGFVSSNVDLILANATSPLQAAVSATSTIPVLGTSITDYASALEIDNWTGTVGTNQCHNFALVYFKGNTLDGVNRTIVHMDVVNVQHTHLCVLLAQISLDNGGILADFLRRALGNQAAIVQHGNGFAHVHHQVHVMLNQENSNVEGVADAANLMHQLGGFAGVHTEDLPQEPRGETMLHFALLLFETLL